MAARTARPSAALPLGRVLGVPVLVSPLWLVAGAGCVLLLDDALGSALAAGGFAALLLLSVLLHEVAHCVVARAFGLPVRSITITLLAGLTEVMEPPETPAREYSLAVSGPLVSVLLGGVAAAAEVAAPDGSSGEVLAASLALVNLGLAAFNLLPGLPLDGGRVLRAVLWQLTGDPRRATVLAAQAGRALAVAVLPLLLVGVAVATGSRVTLPGAALLGVVSSVVWVGATAALRREQVSTRLGQVTAGGLARPALRVGPELPLSEALRRVHEADLQAVLVVDAGGQVRAVVGEQAVQAVPLERRPWVAVGALGRAADTLDAALSGERLLDAVQRAPAPEWLVDVDGDVRVLVADDVGRAAGVPASVGR